MHTTDRLWDKDRREITTVWTTTIRVNEGTYDSGTIRVALTTHHNKSAKRIETVLNREVLTDSGFITRKFTLFAGPSADAGITLAKEPLARFSANKAAALHGFVLDNLALMLTHDGSAVAQELFNLIEDAKQSV